MQSYYFLINSLTWAWAERVVTNLAKQHLSLWEKVFIFTLRDQKFYDIPNEINYIPLSKTKKKMVLFSKIHYVYKFKKYLKKYWLTEGISLLEQANIIHVLAKKDATISLRTHVSQYKWISWYLKKLAIKIFYPKAKKIIVNSRENKMELAKFLNISEEKIDVRYNPIDKKEIHQLKNERIDDTVIKKIQNKKVFITVSRLVYKKKIEKILNALELYNQHNKNWIFLILGEWPKKNELKDLAKKLWINNKILFLWQQRNVFKYLKHADYFLFSSENEGFPNALLEARELWIPIITTDFKTWAKEIILWEDTNLLWKNLSYPYHWKYWILVDKKNCSEQMYSVLKRLTQ